MVYRCPVWLRQIAGFPTTDELPERVAKSCAAVVLTLGPRVSANRGRSDDVIASCPRAKRFAAGWTC